MKTLVSKLMSAFDTHSKGFSARKLSAFIVIIMVVVLHVKWFASDRWEFLGEVLALDFGFISVCLGMTTYEAIKIKEENKSPQ